MSSAPMEAPRRSTAMDRRPRQRRQDAWLRVRLLGDCALLASHHASHAPRPGPDVLLVASLRLEVNQLRAEILVLTGSLATLQYSVLRLLPTPPAPDLTEAFEPEAKKKKTVGVTVPVVVAEVGAATVAAAISEMEVAEVVVVPDAAEDSRTFSGIISTWVAGDGYITPDEPDSLSQNVNDDWARWKAGRGQVYFRKSDVNHQEGFKLFVGVAVTFKLYVDCRGAGANAFEVSPASLLSSADADNRSVRARLD